MVTFDISIDVTMQALRRFWIDTPSGPVRSDTVICCNDGDADDDIALFFADSNADVDELAAAKYVGRGYCHK